MCNDPRWGLSMANESLFERVHVGAYLFLEHCFFCFKVAFWSMIQTFKLIPLVNSILGGPSYGHKKPYFVWGEGQVLCHA